jgi:2-polyprenyl-3-methyl-5-hydroxy-6-metoxy-1,4-benzoquinol methylase
MNNTQNKFNAYLTSHLSQVNTNRSSISKKERLKYNYQTLLPNNLESKILEIGPGFGELLLVLCKDLGYVNIKAIDISQEVVDYCNSILPESTEFTDNTIEFLKSNKNLFKMVFMLHVLEHIPKQETISILSEIYSALETDGTLIIEVPNMANPITGLNLRYADFTHEVGFTEISLKQVLYKAGFSSVSVYPSEVPNIYLH